MKLKRLKKILFPAGPFGLAAFFLALFLLSVLSVSAADYVPLAPIPGTICPPPAGATAAEVAACASVSSGGTNLNVYLTGVFKVGIAAAGVLAFLMIVWGGFTYLSTDAITGKEEGKARVQRALGGLVLALAAYIILNTINPQLVNLNLNFGPATKPKNALTAPTSDQLKQLDAFIDEINKNLTATKNDAQKIESAVTDLKARREELSKQMEEGDFSGIDEYNSLTKKITVQQTDAQAIRDYNTEKDNILAAEQKGVRDGTVKNSASYKLINVFGQAGSLQVDSAETYKRNIDTVTANSVTKLTTAINTAKALGDTALEQKYTQWLNDVKQTASTAKTNIDKAYGGGK